MDGADFAVILAINIGVTFAVYFLYRREKASLVTTVPSIIAEALKNQEGMAAIKEEIINVAGSLFSEFGEKALNRFTAHMGKDNKAAAHNNKAINDIIHAKIEDHPIAGPIIGELCNSSSRFAKRWDDDPAGVIMAALKNDLIGPQIQPYLTEIIAVGGMAGVGNHAEVP